MIIFDKTIIDESPLPVEHCVAVFRTSLSVYEPYSMAIVKLSDYYAKVLEDMKEDCQHSFLAIQSGILYSVINDDEWLLTHYSYFGLPISDMTEEEIEKLTKWGKTRGLARISDLPPYPYQEAEEDAGDV